MKRKKREVEVEVEVDEARSRYASRTAPLAASSSCRPLPDLA